MGVLNNSPIPGCLTWIKPYNHVMLSNPKYVNILPYCVAITNGIFPKLNFFKEITNPDGMEIKYELVLNGMTWSAVDCTEYNTIGAFKPSDCNTPGYYIV